MALKFKTYHGKYNRTWRSGGLGSIANYAVHYTGTDASAENNCIYFAGGNRKASADMFVNTDGTAVEYNNPLDGWFTWHCGDGGGKYGITNSNSIGVEVVSSGKDFTSAQIRFLHEHYKHMCDVLGRKLSIVRHYDASRKYCPAPYVNDDKWQKLKYQIENGYGATPNTKPPSTATAKPAASSAAKPASATATKKEEKVRTLTTIKSGSTGKTVKMFQASYNAIYGGSLAIDGSCGPKTVTAIKSVQKKGKITQDGICGPNTWGKMYLG